MMTIDLAKLADVTGGAGPAPRPAMPEPSPTFPAPPPVLDGVRGGIAANARVRSGTWFGWGAPQQDDNNK